MSVSHSFSIEEAVVLLGSKARVKKNITVFIEGNEFIMDEIGTLANIVHIAKYPDDENIKIGIFINDNDLQEYSKDEFWDHFEVMY